MVIKEIYIQEECSLKSDTENCILYISSGAAVYNPDINKIFLEYLTNFWKYVKDNNLKYHILLDLSESKVSVMPFDFYKTLVMCLYNIQYILSEHLHSTCILVEPNNIMRTVLAIIFSLYTPVRPIKMVNNKDEISAFFLENKLDF